jgi:glycosyltransferase involved in cell wall biosynthesis
LSLDKNLLFITPYLERTGSELVLLDLVLSLDNYNVNIASYNKGALLDLLKYKIHFINLRKYPKGVYKFINWIIRIITGYDINELNLLYFQRKMKFDFWYVNTMAMPEVVMLAKKNKIKVLLHSHELFEAISKYSTQELEVLAYYPKHVVCCSNAAKFFFDNMGRKDSLIVIHPPLFNFPNNSHDLNKLFKIDKGRKIWVMAGRFDENKNPFFFIQVLLEVLKIRPEYHFIWFGGNKNSGFYSYCRGLIKNEKVENHVTFAEIKDKNLVNYFCNINGLVLTSRFESFSLLALEVMSLNKPVVTYSNGGVVEVLGEKYPLVANYNSKEYAKMIIEFDTNTEFRDKTVNYSSKRVSLFNLMDKRGKLMKVIEEI